MSIIRFAPTRQPYRGSDKDRVDEKADSGIVAAAERSLLKSKDD